MNKIQQNNLEFIQEQEKKGNVVFLNFEGGAMVSCLDEFIQQPADGILYDLNFGKETTIALADTSEVMRERWINDYAVAVVIEKLKSEIDRLNGLLK